jgi:ubiquinone/menaquinone biosynthesis C-methylase UbiE
MTGASTDGAGSDDSSAEVRAAYNAVAREYDRQLGDELDAKPLDRALLTALVELVGTGTIADVGCGPGHVTRYLATLHNDVLGVDLSPAMITVARERAPRLTFTIGSMLGLAAAEGGWAGVVSLYSIIHLTAHERLTAFAEFARVTQPGGWLLIAFHVDSPEFMTGQINHITDWFGQRVELDGHFLDPDEVASHVSAAGFTLIAKMDRRPTPEVEYPSRRCYLLLQRHTRTGSDRPRFSRNETRGAPYDDGDATGAGG